MVDKIRLGRLADGQVCYLTKHEWQCDWYWAFGYLGNSNTHFHIDSLIDHPAGYNKEWTNVSYHFKETFLTQNDWWILRDLFITAYAFKKAAECYRYGGHQTEKAEPLRAISPAMEKMINKDLEMILTRIWDYVKDKHDNRGVTA